MQPAARQTGPVGPADQVDQADQGSAREADRNRSIRDMASWNTASLQPQPQQTCSSREAT